MMVTDTVSSHSAVSRHLDPHVYATQLTRTKDQTEPSLLAQPYIFPCATHPGKPKCFTQINIIIQLLLYATVVLHAKWELCACMPTNWDWQWFGPGQYCTLVSSGNNFGIYTKWWKEFWEFRIWGCGCLVKQLANWQWFAKAWSVHLMLNPFTSSQCNIKLWWSTQKGDICKWNHPPQGRIQKSNKAKNWDTFEERENACQASSSSLELDESKLNVFWFLPSLC